jgi:hypothetical protein
MGVLGLKITNHLQEVSLNLRNIRYSFPPDHPLIPPRSLGIDHHSEQTVRSYFNSQIPGIVGIQGDKGRFSSRPDRCPIGLNQEIFRFELLNDAVKTGRSQAELLN